MKIHSITRVSKHNVWPRCHMTAKYCEDFLQIRQSQLSKPSAGFRKMHTPPLPPSPSTYKSFSAATSAAVSGAISAAISETTSSAISAAISAASYVFATGFVASTGLAYPTRDRFHLCPLPQVHARAHHRPPCLCPGFAKRIAQEDIRQCSPRFRAVPCTSLMPPLHQRNYLISSDV